MPVITPAELWKRSGRYGIEEVFKLKDRRGAELVLAMTHEETVTLHVANAVKSYREPAVRALPLPDQGPRRATSARGPAAYREFIMKDAYTFDRDFEGLRAPTSPSRAPTTHLRPLRARVVLGGVRRRRHGRHGRPRVHGAVPGGRERRRAGPRLRRQREIASADPRPVPPRPQRRACTRRGRRRSPRSPGAGHRPRADWAQGVPGRHRVARARCSSSCAATTASTTSSSRTRSGSRCAPRARTSCRGPGRLPRAVARASRCCYDDATRAGGLVPAPTGPTTTASPPSYRRARRHPHGRGGRHRRRPPDPYRARHRGRQHLQARHPLLRAARARRTSTRTAPSSSCHGLLRHRPRAHRGRRHRAVRRREGHSWPRALSPWDVEVVRLGKPGTPSAPPPRPCTRSWRAAGLDALLDDPDAGHGREVRRRRAARGAAAPDRRQALAGVRRPPRPRSAAAAPTTRAACR